MSRKDRPNSPACLYIGQRKRVSEKVKGETNPPTMLPAIHLIGLGKSGTTVSHHEARLLLHRTGYFYVYH